MKYIDEYRDRERALQLAAQIGQAVRPGCSYRLMEFCGGHTHSLFRYGLKDLLPAEARMVHGPGCPVCVLPVGRIDLALQLAQRDRVILCSYADMLRVPGSAGRSLLATRADGADVRMVYSAMDALRIASENPEREVVFFAIGFETTAPATAVVLQQAKATGLANFSVYCNHVLTPSAIASILDSPQVRELGSVEIDGFVGPAHVSAIIGSRPYEHFASEYQKPVVIAGFEPLDMLQAILMLVRQVNDGRYEVENQYSRVVTRDGNRKAQALVAAEFELRQSFAWRGLGSIPYSALQLRADSAALDAERRFELSEPVVDDHPGCDCGAVLRGLREPVDCRLFATACTPDQPIGPCMVSPEGACAAYFGYGRHRGATDASRGRSS